MHVNAQIYKESSKTNFVEVYLTHNGTDTSISEFYFDTEEFSRSSNLLGSFNANLTSGNINLTYENESDQDLVVKTRIVGFGTAVGVGTFRYILPNQPEGNERSAVYKSDFSTTTSAAPISFLTLDKNLFDSAKSLVELVLDLLSLSIKL